MKRANDKSRKIASSSSQSSNALNSPAEKASLSEGTEMIPHGSDYKGKFRSLIDFRIESGRGFAFDSLQQCILATVRVLLVIKTPK